MIEPFGQIRSEIRHGQSMAMTVNMNRDRKAHPKPFPAKDYMNFLPPEMEKSPEPKAEDPKVLSARIARELFGFRGKR